MAYTREAEGSATKRANAQTKGSASPARANRELYKVLPVRLPMDKWAMMSREADELGIGTCTLARIWILDSLRRARNDGNGNELNPDR